MSIVHLKNKKNGITYVYECHSFWNKEKKRADSKRTCIGKLDPKTNEIIPSKRSEVVKSIEIPLKTTIATIRTIGPSLLFDHICEETELTSILRKSLLKIDEYDPPRIARMTLLTISTSAIPLPIVRMTHPPQS